MKKYYCVIVLGLLFAGPASAQISSNIQLGLVNTFGQGSSYRSIGFGGGLTRPFNDNFVLGFSANLYFGGKLNVTDTALAYSGSTTPQTIEVEVVRKVIAYSGQLELKYYFVGDVEDEQGVYALLGIGALKMAIKTKSIGEYDASSYGLMGSSAVGDLSSSNSLGPMIGIGYEKGVGNTYFFVNVRFHTPIYSDVDPGARFAKAPQAVTLETGFRFPG